MEFHGMKRKALQSLCKKHGIPANLKNSEMAARLASVVEPKNVRARSKRPIQDLQQSGIELRRSKRILLAKEKKVAGSEIREHSFVAKFKEAGANVENSAECWNEIQSCKDGDSVTHQNDAAVESHAVAFTTLKQDSLLEDDVIDEAGKEEEHTATDFPDAINITERCLMLGGSGKTEAINEGESVVVELHQDFRENTIVDSNSSSASKVSYNHEVNAGQEIAGAEVMPNDSQAEDAVGLDAIQGTSKKSREHSPHVDLVNLFEFDTEETETIMEAETNVSFSSYVHASPAKSETTDQLSSCLEVAGTCAMVSEESGPSTDIQNQIHDALEGLAIATDYNEADELIAGKVTKNIQTGFEENLLLNSSSGSYVSGKTCILAGTEDKDEAASSIATALEKSVSLTPDEFTAQNHMNEKDGEMITRETTPTSEQTSEKGMTLVVDSVTHHNDAAVESHVVAFTTLKQDSLLEDAVIDEAGKEEEHTATDFPDAINITEKLLLLETDEGVKGDNLTAKSHDASDVLPAAEHQSVMGDSEQEVDLLGESNTSPNPERHMLFGNSELDATRKMRGYTSATCEDAFVFTSPERQQLLVVNAESFSAGKQEQKEVDDSVVQESHVAASDFRENTIVDSNSSSASKVAYNHELIAGQETAGAELMSKDSQAEDVVGLDATQGISKKSREHSPHVDLVNLFEFDTEETKTIMEAETNVSFSSYVHVLPAKSETIDQISSYLEVVGTCAMVSEESGPSTDIQNQIHDALEGLAIATDYNEADELVAAKVTKNIQMGFEENLLLNSSTGSYVSGKTCILAGTEDKDEAAGSIATALANVENSAECWNEIQSSKDGEKGSLEKTVQAEDLHGNLSEYNSENSKVGCISVSHCVNLENLDDVEAESLNLNALELRRCSSTDFTSHSLKELNGKCPEEDEIKALSLPLPRDDDASAFDELAIFTTPEKLMLMEQTSEKGKTLAVDSVTHHNDAVVESQAVAFTSAEKHLLLETDEGVKGDNITAKSHVVSDVVAAAEHQSVMGDSEPDEAGNKYRENKDVDLLAEPNTSPNPERHMLFGNSEVDETRKIRDYTSATCEDAFVFTSPERQQQLVVNAESFSAGKQEQKEVDDSVVQESDVAAPDFRENTIVDSNSSSASKVSYNHELNAGQETAGAELMSKDSQAEDAVGLDATQGISKKSREHSPHVDLVNLFEFDTEETETIMEAETNVAFSSYVHALPAKSETIDQLSSCLEVAGTCAMVSEESGPSTDIQNQIHDALEGLAIATDYNEADELIAAKVTKNIQMCFEENPLLNSTSGSYVSGKTCILAGTEDKDEAAGSIATALEKSISLTPDEFTVQNHMNEKDEEMITRETTPISEETMKSSPENRKEYLNIDLSETQARRETILITRTQVKPTRHDMKENAPNSKIVHNLNVTAPRTKRQPLQDLSKN